MGPGDKAVTGKLFGPVENLSVQRHTSQLATDVPGGLAVKIHQNLRAETWPGDTAGREKLYNPVDTFQRTATNVPDTGLLVRVN